MESQKQTGPQNPLVRALPDCRALYKRCLAEQQKLDQQNQKANKANKEVRTATLAFGPLLPPKPELESSPSPSDPPELKTSKDQWMADKYRQLLSHTKTAIQQARMSKRSLPEGLEALYQILAMWLQDEGIVSPQEFLPPDLFSQLTKTTRKPFGSYRPAEKYYADLVEAWFPYFEHLMQVYRFVRREKQIGKKLEEKGYDSDAVRIVVHRQHRTRTALSAAIQFVALRKTVGEKTLDEDTIRTAHSSIYGRIRKNLPAMTFPEKEST